jgi:hypothetical protein
MIIRGAAEIERPDGPFAHRYGQLELTNAHIVGPNGLVKRPNGHFERATGHFERPNGLVERPNGHCERTTGHFERVAGHCEQPDGPAEKQIVQAEPPNAEPETPNAVPELLLANVERGNRHRAPAHLYTTPPFITNTTRRTAVMSVSGSPSRAMMSAS